MLNFAPTVTSFSGNSIYHLCSDARWSKLARGHPSPVSLQICVLHCFCDISYTVSCNSGRVKGKQIKLTHCGKRDNFVTCCAQWSGACLGFL